MAYRPSSSIGLYEPHGEVTTRLWLLLPLRVYTGFYFVTASFSKVASGYLTDPTKLSEGLLPIIESPEYPYGLYRAFFQGMIEPYPGLFCFAGIFGALLIGIALISGTLVRLFSALGFVLVIGIGAALGVGLLEAHNTTTVAMICLVLWMTGAGRAYGVDHFLRGRVPGWLA